MNKKDLTQKDREYLESILDLEVYELDDIQRGAIKARRDYLSGDERKKFAEVLEAPAKRKLDKLTKAELLKEAQAYKLVFKEDATNDEIRQAIEKARE